MKHRNKCNVREKKTWYEAVITEWGVTRELKDLSSHEVNDVDADAENSEVVVDDVRDVVELVPAETHVVLIVSKKPRATVRSGAATTSILASTTAFKADQAVRVCLAFTEK